MHNNTIHEGVLLVVLGEGGPAKKTITNVGGIEVEVIGIALAKSGLSLLLSNATRGHHIPVVVGSDVLALEGKLPSSLSVGSIEHIDLIADLLIRHLTSTGRVSNDVHVHTNSSPIHSAGNDVLKNLVTSVLSGEKLLLSEILHTAAVVANSISILVEVGHGGGHTHHQSGKKSHG